MYYKDNAHDEFRFTLCNHTELQNGTASVDCVGEAELYVSKSAPSTTSCRDTPLEMSSLKPRIFLPPWSIHY